jgi:HD-GYP domain-containing protein (c-di-GMP phosphodiesterase class II)
MSKAYAVAEIIKCSGSQFDPNIAKIFVEKILKEKFVTNK